LTENGFVRVISQPNYPNPISATFALDLLAQQISGTDHAFWPDDISILGTERFDRAKFLGPKQLTDVYLLALAITNGGRLVTLDDGILLGPVRGADPRHLVVI
jgi:predicted nucleic acid-binding protein